MNIIKSMINYISVFILSFLIMYTICYVMLLSITIDRTPDVYHAINGMSITSGILFAIINTLMLFGMIREKNKLMKKIEKENNMTDLEKKQKQYDSSYKQREKLNRLRESYNEEIKILNFDINWYDEQLLKLTNEIRELEKNDTL